MKKHNFSAGPAILPQTVFEQAAQAVLNFNNSGLSILEISHRSPDFIAVMDEIEPLTLELLGLSAEEYVPMFLSGGASSQFFMVAMNLLNEGESAAYVDTGAWSTKAIKEAKLFGDVKVIASSKDANYNYIPKGYEVPSDAQYVHITTNNTIFGTQFHSLPDTDKPIIADMSSDIFSVQRDFSRFGVIYAGAQKNVGPAGVTMVIVRRSLLDKIKRTMPSMLNYKTHVDVQSSYNTPPAFPIYVSLLSLRWLKEQGGVAGIEAMNKEKAALLYDEIDRNSLFEGTAAVEDRSLMNVTFLLKNVDMEKAFMDASKAANISGIKGHRSVGGFRASIYNAMPKSSIQVLVDVMKQFEVKHG